MNRKKLAFFGVSLVLALPVITACSEDSKPVDARVAQAEQVKTNNQYIPVNGVESRNYYGRQRVADDPASLLWCTEYPSNMNVKPFTIPIVGKLTSGNKRPKPTTQTIIDNDTTSREYNPELPGEDQFFGSSGDYRYGFDPSGNYHEFWGLESYCSTVPSVIQKNTTDISVTVSGELSAIDAKVQEALKRCQKTDTDITKRCPEAANLLGIG